MRNLFIVMLIVFCIGSYLNAQQTFSLKDGTVIRGEIINETSQEIIIKTLYGEITLNKSEIIDNQLEVRLKNGEKLTGSKISESEKQLALKTKFGNLIIDKSNILDIKEISKDDKTTVSNYARRPYSLSDMLFGTAVSSNYIKSSKNKKFVLGEENLIDTFFDPTANILDEGILYLSGLSFAFGVTKNLQVSSRWSDYFRGNFNIRPKYQIFKEGNWERESALSIGGHFHTFWQPNKVVWQSGRVVVCEEYDESSSVYYNNSDDNCNSNQQVEKYFGGYFPIGSEVLGNLDYFSDRSITFNDSEDLDMMFELFSAYTFSKSRAGMRGRIAATFGGSIQIPINYDVYPYRLFTSLDIDLTPQLKLISEAFYDPFYLDINNRESKEDCFFLGCLAKENYTYQIDDNPVTESNFSSIRPIHFDFGFMYAVNENFRIGIHNQPYIIAFYWKF